MPEGKAYLEVLLHQGRVAVVTTHGVVQAALVVVFLGDVQTAVAHRTFHRRVLAVEHNVVVDIDTVIDPVAPSLAVGTLDYKLVQHVLHNLGHRPDIAVGLDLESAGGTRLAAIALGRPGVLEAVAAEVVLAGQLDGLVEGRVADQADEVAVGGGDVLERLQLGRDFDDSAASTLRRG